MEGMLRCDMEAIYGSITGMSVVYIVAEEIQYKLLD